MNDKNNNKNAEMIEEAFQIAKKLFSPCKQCKHNNVCKYLQERETQTEVCPDFLNAETYKAYTSIYEFFQPIFDWLSYHYPHGEIKFIVDHTSAKMYLEHGVFAISNELKNFHCLSDKDKND